MFAATFALILKFLCVFLIVIAVVDVLTMSTSRKVHLYRQQGFTQKAIAERLGISTYQVRKALATVA